MDRDLAKVVATRVAKPAIERLGRAVVRRHSGTLGDSGSHLSGQLSNSQRADNHHGENFSALSRSGPGRMWGEIPPRAHRPILQAPPNINTWPVSRPSGTPMWPIGRPPRPSPGHAYPDTSAIGGNNNDNFVPPSGGSHLQALSDAIELHGADHPDGWLHHANPSFNQPGGGDNCQACSRLFADIFHGKIISTAPTVNGSRPPGWDGSTFYSQHGLDPNLFGSNFGQHSLINTANFPPDPVFDTTASHAVHNALQQLPPGSVAQLRINYAGGGAHTFNAFTKHDGSSHFADLQTSQTGPFLSGPMSTCPIINNISGIQMISRPSGDAPWSSIDLSGNHTANVFRR